MPKKKRPLKHGKKTRSPVSRKTKPKKPHRTKLTLKQRIARAQKLERLDARKPAFKLPPRRMAVETENVVTTPPPLITGSVGRWEKGQKSISSG
jgi:hypothetical protein